MKRIISIFLFSIMISLLLVSCTKDHSQDILVSSNHEVFVPGVDGVSEPELLVNKSVEYPEKARMAGVEGKVILRVIIRKNGSLSDIEVLQEPLATVMYDDEHLPLIHRVVPVGLGDAASDAVKDWLYRPAMKDGQPVDVYFTVVVNFNLEGIAV